MAHAAVCITKCSLELKSLQLLDLRENQLTDEQIKALAEAISNGALSNLVNLNLGGNWIGAEGMHTFVEAISKGAVSERTKVRCE